MKISAQKPVNKIIADEVKEKKTETKFEVFYSTLKEAKKGGQKTLSLEF